jgi:hypothetical protein
MIQQSDFKMDSTTICAQAIVSIVSILEKYDEDKNFEAYGFGGMLPSGQVLYPCGDRGLVTRRKENMKYSIAV